LAGLSWRRRPFARPFEDLWFASLGLLPRWRKMQQPPFNFAIVGATEVENEARFSKKNAEIIVM
jgi:hypothetical protein